MKLSPAFVTLLHILWSSVFGLVIAGGTAVIQYNTKNGINLAQDAILFSLTVLTGLGSAFISTLHAIQTSPALPVAEAEAANVLAEQAHKRIDSVITWLEHHAQEHAVQTSQSVATPSSLKPTVLQPIAPTSTPVAPSVPNLPPPGAMTLNTIPGMPVVTPVAAQ